MRKGWFITFEGIEGCGKSTCSKWAAKNLRSRGFHVTWTREPGGTPGGRIFRTILLDASGSLDPLSELVLYSADRRLHAATCISPHLKKGHIVISDRYTDSTLAYQGGGRRLPTALLRKWVLERDRLPRPDLTIVLDLPVEVGLQRMVSRGRVADRMERENLAFHRRVRKGFLRLAADDARRYRVIDAAMPLPAVKKAVQAAITSRLQV